jgi:hypothetical protein
MAAKEVIHFPFCVQLASRSFFPAVLPPQPVSESPPELTRDCVCLVRSEFRPPRYRCVPTLYQRSDGGVPAASKWEIHMQKAHLYEAILLVNRGVDEAVRGFERLKRAKDSQLDPSCFDEELVFFEDHRARLNSYVCTALQRSELRDSARFEARCQEYEKNSLDEVQLYRDVQVAEDRRRVEGKPPKVRFFTPEEQHEWERQYPKTPGNDRIELHRGKGEQP